MPVSGKHGNFAQLLAKGHYGRDDTLTGRPPTHDLEKPHYVCRAEEMCPNHHLRTSCRGSDRIDIETGCVRREHTLRLRHSVHLREHLLLQFSIFEYRSDHDINSVDTHVGELRTAGRKPF